MRVSIILFLHLYTVNSVDKIHDYIQSKPINYLSVILLFILVAQFYCPETNKQRGMELNSAFHTFNFLLFI